MMQSRLRRRFRPPPKGRSKYGRLWNCPACPPDHGETEGGPFMCPACLANLTTLIMGSGSLGGAAAFLGRKLRLSNTRHNGTRHSSEEEDTMATSTFTTHPVVSRDEWTAARKELLEQEKQLTHARDVLNEKRRALPW